MIAKKDSRIDLEKNRSILIQIGLLTAGSFTLAAFTYRSPIDYDENYERHGSTMVAYEFQEIQKPKEPEIKVKAEPIQKQEPSVKAELNPNENIKETKSTLAPPDVTPTFDPNNKFKIGDQNVYTKKKIKGEIIIIPDKEASFVGEYPAMVDYIQQKVEYPDISMQMRHQGTVGLTFVVEKDGSVTNVKVVKKLTPELDREAKRIVKSFPDWIPGEVEFAPVRTRVYVPITFELQD